MNIPIRNLYYLLCYAWDVLPESHIVEVGIDDADTGQDLLARVLVNGVTHLRRRGLMREYRTCEESVAGVRGKLLLSETLKQNLLAQARTRCGFDELNADALPNQIVKATLRLVGTATGLNARLRSDVAGLYHSLGGITDVTLSGPVFGRVQLHRNIGFYRLLLNVCRFIYEQVIPEEGTTRRVFRDFVRHDDQMGRLFQKFVLNFFRREQSEYRVDSPQIDWQVSAESVDALAWLPLMQTDVVLRSALHTVIIDTKFYREAFQSRFSQSKIRSEHLYQIVSYTQNWPAGAALTQGTLLYPTVRQHFDFQYRIQGLPIRVCSVDLNQPWTGIRTALLALLPIGIDESGATASGHSPPARWRDSAAGAAP
jgi:5-methylcytosine-specific restriction enzyme subunit McrC